MVMLSVVNLAMFAATYRGIVRSYNTTMLALSYEYGFTSRSLLGTIYHFLDDLLPWNLMDYQAVLVFALIITILFFGFLEYFFWRCLKLCGEVWQKDMHQYLVLILSLCLVSTFSFSL